ncbi:CASP-like protein 2D1 [Cucurbita maxima]|uniref:CASP-like protein n=1 Tax=Cucurbita maxima TaxID=3661 RepID=A0A6J1J679_CUCMA|nr:CASP-like protein 2D1 [Cucurbita maxima]
MEETHNSHPPILKLLDVSLRLLSVPLTIASIGLTVTNRQDNPDYGTLEFHNLSGLKYMVCISAIAAAYALFAAAFSWIRCFAAKAWVFFVSDQIVAYLMVTSVAAVGEILYLAYYGDREVSWSEAYSTYGKFCDKMKMALVFQALGFGCFFVVAVVSAFRAFSIFDPPLPSHHLQHQSN